MQTKTKLSTKQKVAIAVGGAAIAAALVAAGMSGVNLKGKRSNDGKGNPPISAPKTIAPTNTKKVLPGVTNTNFAPPSSSPKLIPKVDKNTIPKK